MAVASRASSSSLLAVALAVAVVVVVALGVSSCSATRDALAAVHADAGRSGVVILDDPKCEEMVTCTFRRCIQYCANIGLQPKGFCNMKPDMHVYCCCVIRPS